MAPSPFYRAGRTTLWHGDARNLPVDDASVDLIVTSPPYFGLRSYTDGGKPYDGQIGSETGPAEFLDALTRCTAEMARVLKPTGSIFVNLGDKYAQHAGHGVPAKSLMLLPERYRIRCVDELGLTARAVMIWSKPNGLPEPVTDRVRRAHEDWVHLTKQPTYFSAIDELRERYRGDRALSRRVKHPGEGAREQRAAWSEEDPRGSLPGSVWDISTQPLNAPAELGVTHVAAFPMEWPRRIILGWSPPTGTVLDPFCGTGTTVLAAVALGRHGIGVDLSLDYCRLAQWRVTDARQRERAALPAGIPQRPPRRRRARTP